MAEQQSIRLPREEVSSQQFAVFGMPLWSNHIDTQNCTIECIVRQWLAPRVTYYFVKNLIYQSIAWAISACLKLIMKHLLLNILILSADVGHFWALERASTMFLFCNQGENYKRYELLKSFYSRIILFIIDPKWVVTLTSLCNDFLQNYQSKMSLLWRILK